MNRKRFIQKLGKYSTFFAAAPSLAMKAKRHPIELEIGPTERSRYSTNDRLNIALIGAGNRGYACMQTALQHEGVHIVAACDLYDSRITRCKENWGKDIFTTKDYLEILDRSDVDAVIIASTDHWHAQHAIDSLNKGKAVYLEKPMMHKIEEGYRIIEAEKNSGRPLLVGSQRTSSILYDKARELLRNGEIGDLNFVEAYWDRNSAFGAGQHPIPPNVSIKNIDWNTYTKGLPSRTFNPKHFFHWRHYEDYGTGIPGDLFVHLFSGLHMILNSKGPETIMASGGLRFWRDGREVPDIILGLYDYPETEEHPGFNLALRVNLADGSGGGQRIRLVGSGGEIIIGNGSVTLRKSQLELVPRPNNRHFSARTYEEYMEYHREKYPSEGAVRRDPQEFIYGTPEGYSDLSDHFSNFFEAIRHNKPLLQNGTFGMRAAVPALLSGSSVEQKKMIRWDATRLKLI